MKKCAFFLILLLCAVQILPLSVIAAGQDGLHCTKTLAGNEEYTGTAQAAVLYEMNTQTLVYAHQPDQRLNPTGIIKVLTVLIALEEGNMDDVVEAKRSTLDSVGVGVVSARLQAGEKMTLGDLIRCIMVSSANDACAVVAEHIAGTQQAFVDKMNARAATLGCANSYFTNVHGLKDEKQYSTARDLAIITQEALCNQEFTELFGLTSYQVNATNKSQARSLTTTNYLMNPQSPYYDARVTGGKPAAATTKDRSLVCVAEMGESRYLCVVLSAQAKMSGSAVSSYTNFREGSKLLDKGFEGYAPQQVLGVGQSLGLYSVAGGENQVAAGAMEELFALLPVGFDEEKLRFDQRIDSLSAPVREGQTIGSLTVSYNGVELGSTDLVAHHDVRTAGSVIQDTPRKVEKDGISFGTIALCICAVVAGAGTFVILKSKGKKKGGKR